MSGLLLSVRAALLLVSGRDELADDTIVATSLLLLFTTLFLLLFMLVAVEVLASSVVERDTPRGAFRRVGVLGLLILLVKLGLLVLLTEFPPESLKLLLLLFAAGVVIVLLILVTVVVVAWVVVGIVECCVEAATGVARGVLSRCCPALLVVRSLLRLPPLALPTLDLLLRAIALRKQTNK